MYVKSVSYDQHQILRWILKLHCEADIELDPTYSKGGFYKKGVKFPKYKLDLFPSREGVVAADAENLPVKSGSISTMVFDPPFLATKGKSLTEPDSKGSNRIVRRFGCYPSEKELFTFYRNSLIEFKRVLKPGGVLIFKCQDKVSSGKQYFSHKFVMDCAEDLGYYLKDLFILVVKNRMIPKWQTVNQQHARKFHSYFLVLENSDKKIIYT